MQETFGVMAMEADDFRSASKFFSEAAATRSRNATARTQKALQESAQEKARWDRLIKVEQITSGVVDDESLATANAEYARVFREPSPFAGKSYAEVKPRLDNLTQQILTTKDRMTLVRDERDFARKQANDKSAADHRAVMEGVAKRAETRREARDKRLAKNSGAVIATPTDNEVDIVLPMVKSAMPELVPSKFSLGNKGPNELLIKANAVASMAKKKMRDHKGGLHFEEAARMALREISRTPGVTYQDGKTPLTAYPITDNGKFEKGMYYEGPKGIGRFNGTGFDLLPSEVNIDELYPIDGGDE